MRRLFTIDDFMVAFISALGYGFGETIARLSGWSEAMCVVASFALGIVLEEVITKIVFSKAVQKSKANRIYTYAAILLVFLLAQYVSIRWMGVSMLEYLQEEFMFVVGLPILGLVVNLLIRGYRVWKIRKRYGDGSQGYVFDVTDEDLEEVNRRNHAIHGEYDADCAVRTRTGVYVGEKYKKTQIFMGIPYAKPPVGALRWKAPEPLPASEAVFEAKNFGASAIQVEHKGSIIRHHRQSEDCLTLNIAAGADKTEAKKPVLVLFHHGDFTYGGAVDPLLYGGDYFYARKEWKTYSKRNLWMICIIDMVIAAFYHYDIVHEPVNEYTNYLLTEVWIRPTITYGLVACFVSETEKGIREKPSNITTGERT